MGRPVVHFEIGGKDGKKLQDFYSELFDWKIEVDEQYNYGMVATGEETGIQGGIFGADEGTPCVRFYVLVDDLQGYLTEGERLGGKTVMPPTPLPGVGGNIVLPPKASALSRYACRSST